MTDAFDDDADLGADEADQPAPPDPPDPSDEPDDESEHGFPIRGYAWGQPIPALDRIPRERWREVMAPLRPMARKSAANAVALGGISAALALVGELEIADAAPQAAALDAPPPRLPAGSPPKHPNASSRQINFRLAAGQYERLVRAAGLYGVRPTTLARMMTVAGVDRALYEARRAHEQEKPW